MHEHSTTKGCVHWDESSGLPLIVQVSSKVFPGHPINALIGASLSEPHSSAECGAKVFVQLLYIHIIHIVAKRHERSEANNCGLFKIPQCFYI